MGEASSHFILAKSNLDASIDYNMRGAVVAGDTAKEIYLKGRAVIIVASTLLLVLTLAAGWTVRRGIAVPIQTMTSVMHGLADGDTAVRIPHADRQDEVGEMARAIQVFKDGMLRTEQLAAEQQLARAAREKRAEAIESSTRRFESSAIDLLHAVAQASGQMDQTAQSMVTSAELTNRQTQEMTTATNLASENVQAVAGATEELSASILAINQLIEHSTETVKSATAEAQQSDATVAQLVEAVSRIDEVVSLINAIARQTNLLALNATIEAARAGDAGKGFSVVANEVKGLANQTARATSDISAQIEGVRAATVQVATAINGIRARMGAIDEASTGIASAMEQQSATTLAISQNVQQAAVGTRQVTEMLQSVAEAAARSGEAADQVLGSARALTDQAKGLEVEVGRFLDEVRQA